MTEEEKKQMRQGVDNETWERCGCWTPLIIVLLLLGLILLTGCRTQYVPMESVREHWHHTSDTVHETDSVVEHETTVVREVDSATMSRYGIELQKAQRAWLIETDRMRKEISQLQQVSRDTTIVRDSIPYPVEVPVEVPARLSWWQQTRIHMGDLLLTAFALAAVVWVVRRK